MLSTKMCGMRNSGWGFDVEGCGHPDIPGLHNHKFHTFDGQCLQSHHCQGIANQAGSHHGTKESHRRHSLATTALKKVASIISTN